jgi:hypothetical protein
MWKSQKPGDIRHLWTQLYDIWKHRCDTNHGTDGNTLQIRASARIQPQIDTIFNKIKTVEVQDCQVSSTKEAINRLQVIHIKKWLFKHRYKYENIKSVKKHS